ncbi:hypothetical protein ASD19_11365 [Microbacterium sp. Root53]|nr:hypothetical protein ASD19_11365 [Microbacterium sp. Root53]
MLHTICLRRNSLGECGSVRGLPRREAATNRIKHNIVIRPELILHFLEQLESYSSMLFSLAR